MNRNNPLVKLESYCKEVIITRVELKQLDDFAANLFAIKNPVTIDRKQLLIARYRKEVSDGSESNNTMRFNDLDDENIARFYEKIKDPQIQAFYEGLIKRLKLIILTSSCLRFEDIADKHICAYIKRSLNQIYPYNY